MMMITNHDDGDDGDDDDAQVNLSFEGCFLTRIFKRVHLNYLQEQTGSGSDRGRKKKVG